MQIKKVLLGNFSNSDVATFCNEQLISGSNYPKTIELGDWILYKQIHTGILRIRVGFPHKKWNMLEDPVGCPHLSCIHASDVNGFEYADGTYIIVGDRIDATQFEAHVTWSIYDTDRPTALIPRPRKIGSKEFPWELSPLEDKLLEHIRQSLQS